MLMVLQLTTDKFTLYSLRENKVIASTEQDTDKWDIGFNKTKIIINGGKCKKRKRSAANNCKRNFF